jgi:uncharacterized delta-60 repeat protein
VDFKGRLVVAFGGCVGDGRTSCSPALVVQRYLPSGAPDAIFAGDGVATISLGPVEYVAPFDVVTQSGNRIIVGATGASNDGGFSLLAALTSAGRPDSKFGDQGRQLVDARVSPRVMATTSDSGVVVGGYSYRDQRARFAVGRYSSTGELVSTFGEAGVMRGDFSSNEWTPGATAIAMDRSGRILVAGEAEHGYGVARLRGDGTFDGSFSGDGRLITAGAPASSTYNSSAPAGLFEMSDGGILVTGSHSYGDHGGCSEIVTARFAVDGSPDQAFGDQGVERHQENCAGVTTALLEPGDQLTTAGNAFNYFDPGGSEYLVRSQDGAVISGRFPEAVQSHGLSDAARLGSGDLILAATVSAQSCAVGEDAGGLPCTATALKRVHPDGSPNTAFGDGGLLTIPSIDPLLDRIQFRLLVAQAMPEVVHVSRGRLKVPLRCPPEVRTGCEFDLRLRPRRGQPIRLAATALDAGRKRSVTAELGELDLGENGSLRGRISSPGQKPVVVNARVKIRG